MLPNGTVKRSTWNDGIRGEWVEVPEEEGKEHKATLAATYAKAEEVEKGLKDLEAELESGVAEHKIRQAKHDQERLPPQEEVQQQLAAEVA